MTIQPIETRYKSYRFRSRLEARWAVFFDALGIAWEYEKEGYDLGEAGLYLPDFYVTYPGRDNEEAASYWIEVKPADYIIYPEEGRDESFCQWVEEVDNTDKHAMFAKHVAPLILVTGMPDIRAYLQYVEVTMATPMGLVDGNLVITGDDQESLCVQEVLLWSSKRRIWYAPNNVDIAMYCREDETYISAIAAARAARFEHGESG